MGKAREKVVDYLDRCIDLDGESFDAVIERLEAFKERIEEVGGIAGSGFIDFEYHGYDGAFEIKLKYRRLETDKEYESRQKSEAKEREKVRERRAKLRKSVVRNSKSSRRSLANEACWRHCQMAGLRIRCSKDQS